jgi:hypothetical protein
MPISATRLKDFRITLSPRVMRDLVKFSERFCGPGDIPSISYGSWTVNGKVLPPRFSIGAGPRKIAAIVDGVALTPHLVTIIDGVEIKFNGCTDFAALGHIHLDYVGDAIQDVG